MGLADQVFLDPETAGDDDPSVFGDGLPDGLEAFLLRAIEKTAGIHQDDVGAGIVAGKRITLGAQRRHDALGIDEGLRTAEADESDLWCLGHWGADIAQMAGKAMIATLR